MKDFLCIGKSARKRVLFSLFSISISFNLFSLENLFGLRYSACDKTAVKHSFIIRQQSEKKSNSPLNPLKTDQPLFGSQAPLDEATKKAAEERMKNLPVTFRKNMGQWDDKVLFTAQSPSWNAQVNFLKDKLSFGFSREKQRPDPKDSHRKEPYFEYMVWNMNFVGANADVRVEAEGKEDSKANYFIGKDEKRWSANVPDYKFIAYKNIYKNIDFNYYSTGKELKYDYVLNPGADVSQIKLNCEGVKKISINQRGQLEIETSWGTIIEEIPESYQMTGDEKKLVQVDYKIYDATTFGYSVKGKYDAKIPLVIDPINLTWATFVGGAGNGDVAYLSDLAVDPAGNVYVTGWCNGNFATTPGSYDPAFNGGTGYGDVFVTKLTPNASALVYSTFVGGSASYERGFSITTNAAGDAFVTGTTYSTDFPTAGTPYQNFFGGFRDVFVFRLSSPGTTLMYSTYIGGAYQDEGFGIVLDASDNAYVTGYSMGTGFPGTAGAFDVSCTNGSGGLGQDAFVSCVNTTGGLTFSTFVGGTDTMVAGTMGTDIALSAVGDIYVTGMTMGLETSPGAYQTAFVTADCCSTDCFIAKFNSTGATRNFCTYIGGNAYDEAYAIKVNAAGESYITGITYSYMGNTNYPTTGGAYKTTPAQGTSFLTKMNSTGTALVFSTFIDIVSTGYDLALNNADEIFVVGDTGNLSGPVNSCSYDSSNNGSTDFFVAKLNAAGSKLLYYTYVGGCDSDYANGHYRGFGDIGIVLTGACKDELYTGGTTHSMNSITGICTANPITTTAGTYQPTRAFGGDMPYLMKLKPQIAPDYTTSSASCGTTVQFTDITAATCVWDSAATFSSWTWDFGDGNTSTQQNPSHTYSTTGTYNVKLVISCPKDSVTKSITVGGAPFTVSTTTVSATCTSGGSATATPSTGGTYTYSWSNAATGQTATNLSAATYTVTVTNSAMCTATATATVTQTGSTFTVSTSSTPGTCTTGGTATATPSTGGTYTYSWSNASTGQTATNLSAATYTVTVTNSGGCTSASTVAVTQTGVTFTVTATSTPVGCSGGGTAAASPTPSGTYTYLWSNAATGQTISGLSAATYTVTTTDTGGCTSIQTTTVGTSTVTVTATTSSTQASCGGTNGSANVNVTTGTSPYTYVWSSGGATGPTLSNVAAGNYSVTVTDAGGCTAIATAAVTNNSTLASTPGAIPGCPETGGAVFAGTPSGGNSPYTYLWSAGGATGATVTGLSSGSYDLTITDASSCMILKTVTLTNLSSPAASAGLDATITSGSSTTLTASGGTSYLWSPPTGLSSTTISNPVASPGATTIYTVTVTDANNCSATDYVIVTVEIKCNGTTDVVFIPNAFSPNGEGAVPNEKIRVHAGSCVKSFIFIVYDRWGQKIFEATSTADEWDGTIDGELAQSGVYAYVIQVTTSANEVVEKKGNITLLR